MAGAELNHVVDEEDDEPPRREREGRSYDFIWEDLLAYKTDRKVRIKDKFLGGLYWGLVTVAIMYIIIYVFHIEGKHMDQGAGIGTVITKFQGKGFAGNKVFDGPDLRFPVIEPSGAFIMTRRITVKDQTYGRCVDWDNPERCPCSGNAPCRDGYCEVKGWCPSIGDFNADNPPQGAVMENITGLEESTLMIASAIAFPSVGNKFFVTGDSPGATNELKSIKLGALLQQANPPVDVRELPRGALIGVSFYWKCAVSQDCEPTTVIKRLDTGQGFVQKRAQKRVVNGEEKRDAVYMFGIRILVDSSGVGRRVSWSQIVVQIGSCLALLQTASWVVDLIMLQFPLERQDLYNRCKVTQTDDYAGLQERLNLVKETQLLTAKQRRDSRVQLGLGTGGRGGSPSTVLRGRRTVLT